MTSAYITALCSLRNMAKALPRRVPAGNPTGGQFTSDYPEWTSAEGEATLPDDVRPYVPRELTEEEINRRATGYDGMVHDNRIGGVLYQHRQDELHRKKMHGPYYEKGYLRIPSPSRNETVTAEWKRRGLRWDPKKYEWYGKVPIARATDQVRKARAIYNELWKMKSR